MPVRDDAWFEQVYRDHATAVFRYFVRRAPTVDAEDLTAEVLATAWRRRGIHPQGMMRRLLPVPTIGCMPGRCQIAVAAATGK